MRIFLSGLAASFALLAVACTDDQDTGSSIALEDVGGVLADSFCPRLEECLGPLVLEVLGGMDCRTQIAASFDDDTLPQLQAAVRAGTATYDGVGMRACINDLLGRGCAIFDSAGPTLCLQAFSGSVAEGQACDQSIECVGDAFCRVETACPGTCVARGGEGAACVDADACQDGLACEASTCVTRASAGETCGGGAAPQCQAGLTCRGEDLTGMTSGTCVSVTELMTQAEGSPCDIEDLSLCAGDLSCVATGTDTDGPTLECRPAATSGGDCFSGLPEMCPAGEYCNADPTMGSFMGTCTTGPGDGEPCATTLLGASCGVGLGCVDDVCQQFRRIGESCASDGQCFSTKCEADVCAARGVCEGL